MRLFALVPLFIALGCAQDAPDARALLKETADVLLHHKSYQLDQQAVIEMGGSVPTRLEMLVKIAVSSPGKLRIESSGKMGESLIVSDGENTWMYVGMIKQYTKKEAASTPESLVKSLVPGMSSVMDQLKAKDPYLSAKIVGEETMEVEGKKIDCYVVEGRLEKISLPGMIDMTDGVQKVWVDKVTKLSLKQTMTAMVQGGAVREPAQMTQTSTVVSQKLDAPVPDSSFTFTPPEGSKQVAEFQAAMKGTDLTGKSAPDFKLPSLAGKDVALQDLKGKFVLLDFWATWCVPCRRDLPVIERIHQEFHRKGLTVIGINAGEDSETINQYLATSKLSYPILLTADSGVLPSYNVTAFPTVVLLDAEGKVIFYHVGAGVEKALRENLAKLGLETEPAH